MKDLNQRIAECKALADSVLKAREFGRKTTGYAEWPSICCKAAPRLAELATDLIAALKDAQRGANAEAHQLDIALKENKRLEEARSRVHDYWCESQTVANKSANNLAIAKKALREVDERCGEHEEFKWAKSLTQAALKEIG